MIDMEGHVHEKTIYEVLESLRDKVYLVKLLGSYPLHGIINLIAAFMEGKTSD